MKDAGVLNPCVFLYELFFNNEYYSDTLTLTSVSSKFFFIFFSK